MRGKGNRRQIRVDGAFTAGQLEEMVNAREAREYESLIKKTQKALDDFLKKEREKEAEAKRLKVQLGLLPASPNPKRKRGRPPKNTQPADTARETAAATTALPVAEDLETETLIGIWNGATSDEDRLLFIRTMPAAILLHPTIMAWMQSRPAWNLELWQAQDGEAQDGEASPGALPDFIALSDADDSADDSAVDSADDSNSDDSVMIKTAVITPPRRKKGKKTEDLTRLRGISSQFEGESQPEPGFITVHGRRILVPRSRVDKGTD